MRNEDTGSHTLDSYRSTDVISCAQKAIRKSRLCFTVLIRDLVYNQNKYPKTRNVVACTSLYNDWVINARVCLLCAVIP